MSRADLKELGEQLDAGQAGLVVVGASDMEAKIEREMRRAEKVQKKATEGRRQGNRARRQVQRRRRIGIPEASRDRCWSVVGAATPAGQGLYPVLALVVTTL